MRKFFEDEALWKAVVNLAPVCEPVEQNKHQRKGFQSLALFIQAFSMIPMKSSGGKRMTENSKEPLKMADICMCGEIRY